MTMTNVDNTNPISTPADEEAFILDQILTLRHELTTIENSAREIAAAKRSTETRLAAAEGAMVDYMLRYGVGQTTSGDISITLGTTTSVIVDNIDAVPERYVRTKIVKEVNKALIRAENLSPNNWLQYSQGYKLTIKNVRG